MHMVRITMMHVENINVSRMLFFLSHQYHINVRGPFGKYVAWSFFLSNRFTNLFMFGIILNSYLASISGHKNHDNIVMQTQNILT